MSVGAAKVPENLERFHSLARDFRAAAERGDADAQERILADRRRLIAELEQTPGPRDDRERDARTRVLESILEIDREAERILERQRGEISGELMALDSGKRGLAGYATGTGSGGKWIDEAR